MIAMSMQDEIVLDIKLVDRLLQAIDALLDSKHTTPHYRFDSSKSVSDNLNTLALYALQPAATLPVLYAYKPVFLDLASRWVSLSSDFEHSYCNASSQPRNSVPGLIILAALSRLVTVSNECLSLTEHFLSQADIFATMEDRNPSVRELESVLLAFYRLLSHDAYRFSRFVSPQVLYRIISFKDSGVEFNVAKLLSIEILSKYLHASEKSRIRMNELHIEGECISAYECDRGINYRFLSILEAKRISNYTKLPTNLQVSSTNADPKLVIKTSDLSSLVTSVCGILVPNLMGDASTREQDISARFVPTENAIAVLREMAICVQENKPIMLYGIAGSGKTFLANQLARYMHCENTVVKIHLGEQTDAKLLLGAYTTGQKPGTFEWKAGVLTAAVEEGRWIHIEDIDKAPTEVLSTLLTLLEKRELNIPSRGEIIKAKNGFQIISTIRTSNESGKIVVPDMIGSRLWDLIQVQVPADLELREILIAKYPALIHLINGFIKCFNAIQKIYSSSSFISLNRGSHPRVISFRDLTKFCARCDVLLRNEGVTDSLQLLETSVYDNIFAEAVDCFGSAVTEHAALSPLVVAIGEALELPTSRINFYLSKHVPILLEDSNDLKIGRAKLQKRDKAPQSKKRAGNDIAFARTNHSLRLMEQVGVAIQMTEPVLLVGETGTGKTTVVQEIANMMNKKLVVINVSQQTESGDLLGGYKPVSTKSIAVPIQEIFEHLFLETFSKKKNERFSQVLSKCFNKGQWKNVIKLWIEAFKMADGILRDAELDDADNGAPKKKRKLSPDQCTALWDQWVDFDAKVHAFEVHAQSLENTFAFDFVEGSLIKAVKNGDWLLLDEINLASPDTLESISDLLSETANQRSVLLTERGDIESVKAHPSFRIFGCMNPSTDVGKRDLPLSIRSRFSEIYVHSPDKEILDLLMIIDKYIARYAVGDEWVGNDIALLYLEAKRLSESNEIVDGANQRPHFSIRTLTRTLIYVRDIVAIYGLRRSLFEGFCMSFLTLLDSKSEELLRPIIAKYTTDKLKNANAVLKQCPPCPLSAQDTYVQFRHFWMKCGPCEIVPQPQYIITPFVEKNMLNLVRATSGRRFPVLVQGPTSAGKTSMIKYLADITGHKFVRINNHEHTDLQEYLGSYVSDSAGKLVFKEGALVEALRKGHWIVLDELNLAPTDVLEALNRLLDDNRELFIPETQEIVHPHPDFMIFATQNPPGIYGGRKILSRAFRNRFLELHFEDIPQDELEIILRERCQIAPTYCKKIVEVYRRLSVQRQSTRLFEQKNSFATLRDLFRWALRSAVGYDELAANGYMLLAERVRKDEEKLLVKKTIEDVMRVQIDMDAYYNKLEDPALFRSDETVVWTKAMRRLAVLVEQAMKYNEPLLLVGETGCGKTTICQILAKFCGKQLITINAHQNTETGDILGAQRPARHRSTAQLDLMSALQRFFEAVGAETTGLSSLDELLEKFDTMIESDGSLKSLSHDVEEARSRMSVLFEWSDGPLTQAMKTGDFFLLDEISLADDSVLERLNSVLEPERSLLLAEKGSDDANITAASGFQFLATMNPGGDYGKKELSPALRNRFTEVWVPSMSDFNDVREIVASRLKNMTHTELIVEYSEWFGKKFGGGSTENGVISLRDILAWVDFINSVQENVDAYAALLHGACMVFIDALGTNNTAFLAEDEARLHQEKIQCVEKLSESCHHNLLEIYNTRNIVTVSSLQVQAGLFSTERMSVLTAFDDFNLLAPTTAANAMRVVRAMQVHKPILLEGSPGVGKTSLISAIAKVTGNPLTRINLSEQTDLVDLFGSDAPAEGASAGQFVWKDAPFLRAMKKGEWVLLDEMNLASQSVLEGLNACLDHRGEAYVPELDRSFPRHPDFKVFAAQNPQYQGGGRKGLPKSFVNRFSVVYVDVLKSEDLVMISQHLYPAVKEETISQLIHFVSLLEEEVGTKKQWGAVGGPWEFNLRDSLRWLAMLNSASIVGDLKPSDFLNMIICLRFRSSQDREHAKSLFESVFGVSEKRDNYYSMTPEFVQINGAIIPRARTLQKSVYPGLVPLQCNFQTLETAIQCINNSLPMIIVGPTNSGKTCLVRFLAQLVGAEVDEFAMTSDVDSMDILGGYEQVDLTKAVSKIIDELYQELEVNVVIGFIKQLEKPDFLKSTLELMKKIRNSKTTVATYEAFHAQYSLYQSEYGSEATQATYNKSEVLMHKIETDKRVKFEWFDGQLVQAVEKGHWLVLDNANLCNPSVLDRLNSLLETNGLLVINECNAEDGTPRTLKPHPLFRLFITMDPKYGELSRAMRNRGVEVYVDALSKRITEFDGNMLGMSAPRPHQDELDKSLQALLFDECNHRPVVAFVPATESANRELAVLEDVVFAEAHLKPQILGSIGVISTSCGKLVNLWEKTIAASSLYTAEHKEASSQLRSVFEFILENGVTDALMRYYDPLDAISSPLTDSQDGFSASQPLHLLRNNALKSRLVCVAPEVDSNEPTLLFDVARRLVAAKQMLLTIETRATNGKLVDLRYIEKSAAHELGRSVKTPPRLAIYRLVKDLNTFVHHRFMAIILSLFLAPGVLQALFELQGLWESLFAASFEQNESKIKVFWEILSAWEDRCSVFAEDEKKMLSEIIEVFSRKLNLTSGSSIHAIWEHFRAVYPKSEKEWKQLERLLSLAAKFDDVASLQFSESFDVIRELRNSIVCLYEDIIYNDIAEDNMEVIFENLTSGIDGLSELSKGFMTQRTRPFEHEFGLIALSVEVDGAVKKTDPFETLLFLSVYSGASTKSLFSSKQTLLPFPPFLSKFWSLENGRCVSLVSRFVSDDLSAATLNKSIDLSQTPGEELNQKLEDAKSLGAQLVQNSNSILTDQSSNLKSVLCSWVAKLIIAHLNTFGLEMKTEVSDLISNLDVDDSASVKLLCGLLAQSQEESFANACVQYFAPCLILLCTEDSMHSLGKAWILFACGSIQLYVPSSPADPAVIEHVMYQRFEEQRQAAEDLIATWARVRMATIGDELSHIEKLLPDLLPTNCPEKPRVYRPSSPIDNLFEEWKAFVDSSINIGAVEKLLESASCLTDKGHMVRDMFQNNSSQFMQRMDKNFELYADLNDILCGYVLGLKLGVNLMSFSKRNEICRLSPDRLWPVDLATLSDSTSVSKVFHMTEELSRTLSVDSMLPEYMLLYFMKLCFSHQYKNDGEIATILAQVYQTIYYRWSVRRVKEEQDSAQSGSLYKHVDIDDDGDAELRALFPDFEEVIDVSGDSSKTNNSFENFYYAAAKVYTDEMLGRNATSLECVMKDGAELVGLMSLQEKFFRNDSPSASSFTSVINRLANSLHSFASGKGKVDFYHGQSVSESRIAIKIVGGIRAFTQKLLKEWPEHATLRLIFESTGEFLLYPASSSLAKMLQKIDQIFTYIAEWEKYASTQVSMRHYYDQLTNLIVSWRRLELSTWQSLFEDEEAAVEKSIGKWWCNLYESIVIPIISSDEQEENHISQLLAALNLFMSQATYGEYGSRLDLLRAFRNHVLTIYGGEVAFNALSNFITYYEQFQTTIDENILTTKKKLEKDISEVILLASWKDVNIDALKQSARRSHNSLYKVVRKYRSLLATSVSPLIEAGISLDLRPVVKKFEAFYFKEVSSQNDELALCESIPTWKDRPARLKNLSVVEKNMNVYVGRLKSEIMPNLYEYVSSIREEMERLKSETPKVLRKDNKKVIAALKTQKRKLLADTLKEIRRIGIKTNLSSDILRLQATVNIILCESKSFEGTELEGADPYYFRIIDILPRLRAAASEIADDVPPADAQKGLAATECLLNTLIVSRSPLSKFAKDVSQLRAKFVSLAALSEPKEYGTDLVPKNLIGTTKKSLDAVEGALLWLPRLVDFAISTIRSCSIFLKEVSTALFFDIKFKMENIKKRKENANSDMTTSQHVALVEETRNVLEDFSLNLEAWKRENGEMAFVADSLLQWKSGMNVESGDNLVSGTLVGMEAVDCAFRDLALSIILAVQKTVGCQGPEITEEDDLWLNLTRKRRAAYMAALSPLRVLSRMMACFEIIGKVDHDSTSSLVTAALCSLTLPLVRSYLIAVSEVLEEARKDYGDMSRSTFILASVLYTLCTKGFCSPELPSEQKEDDNLQDGTGLGDGDGANNQSNDVEDDEDLTEDAQKPNEENKDKDSDDEDNNDAVDIEGDMAGDLEEASDQEKEDGDEDGDEEELDEEIDDIDDLDPNAVDEKMWDEEVKDDKKEKESDKVPENSGANDDEMEANEDDDENAPESKDESNGKEESKEDDAEEEDGEDGEDKDVGEQEDEVKNQENEQMEENVPEMDALELPDDMNLDGDEEDGQSEPEDGEKDDGLDDKMDVDHELDDEEAGDAESDKDAADDQDADPEEDSDADPTEAQENGEQEGAENPDDADDLGEQSEEEELGENDDKLDEGGNDEDGLPQEQSEGVDGADENTEQDDINMESAVKQQAGEKGDGADNQVIEEKEDIGSAGQASSDPQQLLEERESMQDEARDMAQESLKKLGDSMKEFHRRRQEIKEVNTAEKEEQETKANERPDEFQHIEGENTDFDTQALGAADKEEVQKLDEDMAIDDDMDHDAAEPEVKAEEVDAAINEDDMAIDPEAEEVASKEEEEAEADAESKGKTRSGTIGERSQVKQEELNTFLNELDFVDSDDELMVEEDHATELDGAAPRSIEEARELWKRSELATQELASGLCEQLRLILEPTLATKLKGDYKTGKRLNMKRIITYIASEYRKDKIWLRRTKPSKRQYQVMIAVDDSKSMSEGNASNLAFQSIALVSKALTQLESGGLSIVRFGEDVKVVHPFHKPFNNQETGARVFQWFDFQQTKTDIKQLCAQSLKIFEDARATTSSDLWQLQIILSDGVCEDHASIQRMVRQAREQKIMLVFVVMDGINSSESVLDMSQVSYETDSTTGAMNLKVDKYLDTFPFEFYVVVRDIAELPEMLSLILRQYFSEMASH